MYDADKTPIALFSFETKDQWGSTEYAHAMIRFGYEDQVDHTPRYFVDEHPLAGLVISSQGNSRDEERHLYAFEARYHSIYSVDTRKAESMLKTLRKVSKALEAAEAEYGWATDYPEFARRILKALGIKEVWFTTDRSRFLSQQGYSVQRNLGGAVDRIRSRITDWETRSDEALDALAGRSVA
jgi:hypothetical protein